MAADIARDAGPDDALPARRKEDPGRHARRAGGLCGHATPHRGRWAGRSLSRLALGNVVADHLQANGGTVSRRRSRAPTRRSSARRSRPTIAAARIIGPPPPASGGVHIAQMLNILEGFDVAAMGFGSPDSIHLLAETLKIAFADRAVTDGGPGLRQRAGRARDLQSLRVGAPRGDRPAARAPLLGGPPQRRRVLRHDACDGRGRGRLRRVGHAHDQRPLRRLRPDSRHRHDRQQLHAQLRSASRTARFRSRRANACSVRWRR